MSRPSRVFRAPGRINLIGEHTDYNQGFVMPAAIDLATWTTATPRDDRRVVVASAGGEAEFSLDEPRSFGSWPDYVVGVARVLEESGFRLRGANLTIESTVPLGSGLSSSASLEVSVALALLGVAGLETPMLSIARMAQRAEHEYVGSRCGLMDQFAACFGKAGHVLLLDCRSLDFRAVPLPPQASLIVANTMVKHELAKGEYNVRRAECEEAARLLGVASLRDVEGTQFESPRVRHVVTENARVLNAAKALERGDLAEVGRLMSASHLSLQRDFEVSCAELDAMVDAASTLPGVYGARMMGGGFGGCTITLADAASTPGIMREMAKRYRASTGLDPKLYVCRTVDGAGEE